MKTTGKGILLVISIVFLISCNNGISTASQPAMTDFEQTQSALAGTALVETQSAMTINIVTPTALPTFALPTVSVTPQEAPAKDFYPPPLERLDYAMSVAPKIYSQLPYIDDAVPYGEYSGCLTTSDFSNLVVYTLPLSMESVTMAFENYFPEENWAFTEAFSENNIRTSYDVYRIVSEGVPAFERLKVILEDRPIPSGESQIYVRIELTHIETKENFNYLPDIYCGFNNTWLWIRLFKN